MYTFPELIKKIRDEAGLTQTQFASILEVSPVLIAMVETGQKEVSKNLLLKLADKLNVRPTSITPFLFWTKKDQTQTSSQMEKSLIDFGENMQTYLIKERSKLLKKYAQ